MELRCCKGCPAWQRVSSLSCKQHLGAPSACYSQRCWDAGMQRRPVTGARKAPAQLQRLLELQAPHARAPVHKAPQLLVIAGCQAHWPLVPAQHRQAMQVEQPCMQTDCVIVRPKRVTPRGGPCRSANSQGATALDISVERRTARCTSCRAAGRLGRCKGPACSQM